MLENPIVIEKEEDVYSSQNYLCILTIDSREHVIMRILTDYIGKIIKLQSSSRVLFVKIQTSQLSAGDFVISIKTKLDDDDYITALFERKTITDYIESIKDDRCNNKEFMLSLRDFAKCDLFYIIEDQGKLSYLSLSKNSKFINNFSPAVLAASIKRLTVRDKIFVINTLDVLHTCETLFEYCLEYVYNYKVKTLENEVVNGGEILQLINAKEALEVVADLRVESDESILRNIFLEINYITERNIGILSGYTFQNAINQPPASLSKIAQRNLKELSVEKFVKIIKKCIPRCKKNMLDAIAKYETISAILTAKQEILTAMEQKQSKPLDRLYHILTEVLLP